MISASGEFLGNLESSHLNSIKKFSTEVDYPLDSIVNSTEFFSVISKYYLSTFFKRLSKAVSYLIKLSLMNIRESRFPNLKRFISLGICLPLALVEIPPDKTYF